MKKTIGLIILCIVSSIIYWSLVRWFPDTDVATRLLAFSGDSLFRGRFWVVCTAMFIHTDLMHLLGNMLFLYVFGTVLEDEAGGARTLGAFFIGGALSFLLSVLYYGFNTVMLGASGAIFTLAAVVMLIRPLKFSWVLLLPLGLVALLYFAYDVIAVLSIGSVGNIGYLGHITGFLIGFPLGIQWSRGKWFGNLLIAVALLIGYIVVMSLLSSLLVDFQLFP